MTRQANFMTRAVTISAQTQAKRIQHLLALHEIKTGKPLRFAELEKAMEDDGAPLSKSTWHAMRDPSYRITKLDLLTSIANFFGVEHDFLLLEEAEPTEEYERNLQEMQAKQVDETVSVFFRHSKRMEGEVLTTAISSLMDRFPDKYKEDLVDRLTQNMKPGARSA